MEFEYVKNQFEDALDEEIKAQKNQEGQTERITDGKYLGEKEGEFIYSIEIDFETKFPDDTPISVKINEEKITGSIVFSEYETLILSLKDYCGDVIEQAELELTPWFLLEELKKRINEVGLQHEHVRNRFVEVLDTKSKNNYIVNRPGFFGD